MRTGVVIWWDAVSSGRFLTPWSAVVAVPLAVIVLAPYATVETPREFLTAQLASLIVALLLSGALFLVALAERRMSSSTARGVLVLVALVAAAVCRPFLNDMLAVGAFGLGPDPAWAERIVTNVVAWVSILSLVAVTEQLYASSRVARSRLAEALRTVTDEQLRAGRYERESRDFLAAEIATLRVALTTLLSTALDFDRVRDFSGIVRDASHRARRRAGLELADVAPEGGSAPFPGGTRVFWERLRPPAVGLVGAIFAAGSAPFALRAGGPGLAVVVIVGVIALCLVADSATRRLSRRRSRRERGIVLVAGWAVAGLLVSAIGSAIIDGHALIFFIPVVSLPGVAVIAALCAEAVHRGTVESRRLGRALRVVVRSAADRASGTRQNLVHASDVLHGRVQGTCVVLAAQVDDEVATPADIRAFEVAVGEGLSAALGTGLPSDVRPADLAETVAIWEPVLTVSSDVDAAATSAMTDALVSTRVVAVVAEGLVNAVKHAAARSATIEVRSAEDGAVLAVRVSTPGRLRVDARGPGLGVAGLGPSARVFQRGGDVVLEASVPTGAPSLAAVGQAGGALHDSDSM
ncbi:hypothetical protein [Microbacterium sp. cf332]|uniref:hypothetical protein n=1 Tax=Microbacterium sp. cf332 TaxID=1761804 RepID=UPI00115FBB9C|nr:hypothetical protein [Microbacterium sp. cf332]